MANCTYTFIDPLNGDKLVTLPNIHALKAYLFNGGAEALLGDKAVGLLKGSQAFKSLHTAIANGTATDVLDYLASQAKDKSIQSTAEQLKSKIPVDIKIKVLDSHPKGYGMSYNHKNNELNIYLDTWKGNANSAAYERGLAHEFIHAATSYQIDKNSDAKAALNSLISDLKSHAKNNKLDSALTELINHATANTHELLAYGLTEPSLQQLMQDIKASGDKTLWDKFVRTIADLLGIELDKEQKSALSALLMVGDKLLGESTDKPLNFWDKGIYESTKFNDLEWKENSKGMYAWFRGDKQVTGAYVNGSKQMADYALNVSALKFIYERDIADKAKIEDKYNQSVIEQKDRLERTWGRMTDKEIDDRIAFAEKQIKDGQNAAKREFNMNGGRRTSAAVSAEAYRDFAQEKRDLLAYKQIRADAAKETDLFKSISMEKVYSRTKPIDVSELNAGDYFFVKSNLKPNDLIAKVIRKNKSQFSYEVVHSISEPDSERIGKKSKLSFEYIRGSESHMGGFTAKETVLALNPNDAEALINKSEQPQRIENTTKISKLKSELASATKDYAKTYATSHINRIKSISDELYSLTGDEQYNIEQAQPVNAEESRSNNAIKFSKALTPETKNLVIIHNTSIDGLEHTNKIGGMPSPSLAIANKDFPLTGFGEISLIGSKENFAPNAKNKTYNADIYSARYPRVVFLPNERVIDKFNNSFFSENALQLERYGEVISKSDLKYSRGVYDYLKDKAPVMYAYLESIGKAPDLIYEEPKPLSNIPEINKILEKYLPKAQELKNTDSTLTKKFIAEVKKAYSSLRESDGKRPFDDEKMGIIATSMIDTVNDYARTMNNKPKVDIYATKTKLNKIIDDHRNDYKKWINDTFGNIAKDEKIDAGETPSGNRKYIEHNIDNVLKIMKKGGTRNAENFNYGIGNVRAAIAKEYKKLAEIQKDRDKIVSGEEMKKLAEVTSNEYSRISNSIRDDFSSWGLADDYITDVATNGFRWAEREYGVTLSDEKKADITNLFALLRDYPTEYFEIKPQRIVNLHEFSGAVVPNGAEYDKAIEILKKHGVTEIQRYNQGDEKARAEAVNKFSDLHFSKTRKTTNTHTKATLTNALRTVMDREFGQGWFSRLLDTGKFEVMSRAEAQELETTANLDNVQGYYSTKHDKTILIAEQIAKGKDLKGLMLHEIAAHQLALGVDDKTFQSIIEQVGKLADSKIFAKAKTAAIEANTPAEHMNEEILAYLLENHPKLGIVQKFIAWFKLKLRDIGKTLPTLERLKWVQWASKLSEKDLVFMATSALKGAPDSLVFDSVGRGGDAVKLSEQQARFYSALRKAFLLAPEKVFTSGTAVKAWINGNAQKFEVKKDEIYWSGLNDWLDIQGKVSRDDVVRFLDENGVKVEDVELISEKTKTAIKKEDLFFDFNSETNTYEIREKANNSLLASGFSDEESANYWLDDNLDYYFTGGDNTKHNTAKLTIPNGTDYRELVVTIPTIESWNESDNVHFGDVSNGRAVAWIRHNTRTDDKLGSGLFLEEVQSQRMQKGRNGYSISKLPNGWELVGDGVQPEFLGGLKKWKILKDDGSYYSNSANFFGSKENATKIALQHINKDAPPPSPFITDNNNKATNAYISLLMKKAISAAIDNGQNFVAWTTGDQQAERYNLKRIINSISVYVSKSGVRHVTLKPTPDENINLKVNEKGIITDKSDNFVGEKLSNVTGELIANRIMSVDKSELIELQTSNPAWTQAMYGDEQGLNQQGKPSLITQAAGEIARKFGGKIGTVNLSTGTQPALIITPEMRQKVLNEGMPLFSKAKPVDSELQSKITDAIDENWLDIVNEMKRQGIIEIKC